MKIGPKGAALIKEFESCRLHAYRDSVGVWTIGWGHTTAAGSPPVGPGLTITQAQADEIFLRDIVQYEMAVAGLVKVPLNQNQFDALVSLCYNIGRGNLSKSSVIRLVNKGDFDGAAKQFAKWNKAGGKVLNGLTRRRAAEMLLFQSVDVLTPPPPEESGAKPDMPEASKSIVQSKEANTAIVAGGATIIATATQVADAVKGQTDTVQALVNSLGRPTVIVGILVVAALAAIWYWRKQRLNHEAS